MNLAWIALVISAAPLPDGVSAGGVSSLLGAGEVLVLPMHGRPSFEGSIFTTTTKSCDDIEQLAMDVPSWPGKFKNVKSAKVLEQSDTRIRYELSLSVTFSPPIPGIVEHPRARSLVFSDPETGNRSWMELVDASSGCLLAYRMKESAKSGGWVAVTKNVEPSAGDSINFAAGLSMIRGYAGALPAARSAPDDNAWASLAELGTAVRIDRTKPVVVYTLRRRSDRPADEVIGAIRDRTSWKKRSPVIRDAEQDGARAETTLGGFGGSVTFTSTVEDASAPDGTWTRNERVSGGDVPDGAGTLRWRVRPVDGGGSDVELVWAFDPIPGSRVLSLAASADAIAREAFGLHLSMHLFGGLVGGRPLAQRPPRTLATR